MGGKDEGQSSIGQTSPTSTRTEHRLIRERALRSEQQLASAQQITHIGSWDWDVEANVVAWSDELYRIYGLEPQSCEIRFEVFLARVVPEEKLEANLAGLRLEDRKSKRL